MLGQTKSGSRTVYLYAFDPKALVGAFTVVSVMLQLPKILSGMVTIAEKFGGFAWVGIGIVFFAVCFLTHRFAFWITFKLMNRSMGYSPLGISFADDGSPSFKEALAMNSFYVTQFETKQLLQAVAPGVAVVQATFCWLAALYIFVRGMNPSGALFMFVAPLVGVPLLLGVMALFCWTLNRYMRKRPLKLTINEKGYLTSPPVTNG